MTLQSHPNVEEVGPSPSCSTSTSSTDVSPYPYSVGEKTIVLNNEEQTLVGVVTENEFLGTNPNIWVESSTHVDIGNRTFFHGDVTIYQNFPNNVPEVPSGPIEHAVNCTKTATLIPPLNPDQHRPNEKTSKHKQHMNTVILIVVLVLVLAGLSTATAIIYHKGQNEVTTSSTPDDAMSTSTTPIPGSDNDIFVPRSKWGGDQPLNVTYIDRPATLVVIKHTGGSICTDITTCRNRVRDIQRDHMMVYQLPDISYNFLVGGDGKIYVGRGWRVKNEGRSDSLDIAFIGNFTSEVPTESMLALGKRVIAKGPSMNAVDFSSYVIVNHNQTERTDSPGLNLFIEVTRWRFYSDEIFF